MTTPDLDRCAGVLFGLAAGDALGAGYEFRSPPVSPAEMIGGGLGGWDPGEWTDDTQMALCIAEESATGTLDPTAVGQRFLDWFHGHPADVGAQTASVLGRAPTARALPGIARRYYEGHPHGAAGNGSLMRTSPVALFALDDDRAIAELAMATSDLTHAHPQAGEACVLWCVAIDRAVREGRLDGIYDGLALLPPARRRFWREKLDEAKDEPPARFNPNGYVVHALQAALSAVLNTPIPEAEPCRHLQDALQTAVHIGNDTDTVAAIAGSLLGARWGASAAPVGWQVMLHGWPGYKAKDLARLAVLTARGGRPDSAGWPAAEDLSPYYASNWPAEPFVQSLAEDDAVLLANYPGAMETSAAVAVSLCRMGQRDLKANRQAQIWLMDSEDPSANPNLGFIFLDLAKAMVHWRDEGKTVLVHCVMAEHRTPAVAAAYLAERLGISGQEAWTRVKGQFARARENGAYLAALQKVWPG